MKSNDDIFGCFGNKWPENVLGFFVPCYIYGDILNVYNAAPETKAECNGCCGSIVYLTCCCMPCIPGTYFRILRGEEAFTGCLSYTFFPCCALLQDQRRISGRS